MYAAAYMPKLMPQMPATEGLPIMFRYTSLYLMWSLYLRVDNPYPKKLYVATTIIGRLLQELAYALAYVFILVTLCLSWFIGMTRFWDNVSGMW